MESYLISCEKLIDKELMELPNYWALLRKKINRCMSRTITVGVTQYRKTVKGTLLALMIIITVLLWLFKKKKLI